MILSLHGSALRDRENATVCFLDRRQPLESDLLKFQVQIEGRVETGDSTSTSTVELFDRSHDKTMKSHT